MQFTASLHKRAPAPLELTSIVPNARYKEAPAKGTPITLNRTMSAKKNHRRIDSKYARAALNLYIFHFPAVGFYSLSPRTEYFPSRHDSLSPIMAEFISKIQLPAERNFKLLYCKIRRAIKHCEYQYHRSVATAILQEYYTEMWVQFCWGIANGTLHVDVRAILQEYYKLGCRAMFRWQRTCNIACSIVYVIFL